MSQSELTTSRGPRAKEFKRDGTDPLWIDPKGKFVSRMTVAYGDYMDRAQGMPLDRHVLDVQVAHPEWVTDPERVMKAAQERRETETAVKAAGFITNMLGAENLLYELAGLACGEDKDWAEDTLYGDEVLGIVDMACGIARMEDFLTRSQSFPASVAAPAAIQAARKKADAKARVVQARVAKETAEAEAEAEAAEAEASSGQDEPSPEPSERSSSEPTLSDQGSGTG